MVKMLKDYTINNKQIFILIFGDGLQSRDIVIYRLLSYSNIHIHCLCLYYYYILLQPRSSDCRRNNWISFTNFGGTGLIKQSLLMLPQVIENLRQGRVKGLSHLLVWANFSGDLMKFAYFIVNVIYISFRTNPSNFMPVELSNALQMRLLSFKYTTIKDPRIIHPNKIITLQMKIRNLPQMLKQMVKLR